MSEEKLSVQLKKSRADRPDEWTMDRFIMMAEALEKELEDIENLIMEISERDE